MLRSQIAHACGIGHMFTRDKSGKFTKIESEQEGTRLLAEGEENSDYWIFFKDPSVQAFTDLMNRAQDKPREQEIQVTVTHELEMVPARLAQARRRLLTAHAAIDAQPQIAHIGQSTGPQHAIDPATGHATGHSLAPTGQPIGDSGEAAPGQAYASQAIDAELVEGEVSPVSAAITKALAGEGIDKPQ
jgi:hypothetical protein